MFTKRYFQNDWSNVSQEEALRDIQYLLKNYKRYKISILGDRHVLIGNVDIRKEEKTILKNKITFLNNGIKAEINIGKNLKNIKNEKILLYQQHQYIKSH